MERSRIQKNSKENLKRLIGNDKIVEIVNRIIKVRSAKKNLRCRVVPSFHFT
jgi:hypothetical protein